MHVSSVTFAAHAIRLQVIILYGVTKGRRNPVLLSEIVDKKLTVL
jgi:hypothetical protein